VKKEASSPPDWVVGVAGAAVGSATGWAGCSLVGRGGDQYDGGWGEIAPTPMLKPEASPAPGLDGSCCCEPAGVDSAGVDSNVAGAVGAGSVDVAVVVVDVDSRRGSASVEGPASNVGSEGAVCPDAGGSASPPVSGRPGHPVAELPDQPEGAVDQPVPELATQPVAGFSGDCGEAGSGDGAVPGPSWPVPPPASRRVERW
jgi:hypothetical protein